MTQQKIPRPPKTDDWIVTVEPDCSLHLCIYCLDIINLEAHCICHSACDFQIEVLSNKEQGLWFAGQEQKTRWGLL